MKYLGKMNAFWARFRAEDAGAVTVDFVVITAAIVGLAVSVLGSISTAATDLSDTVGDTVESFVPWDEDSGYPPPE